jgi:hypothetical protein
VLLDDKTMQVEAVVDWEWAHPGEAIEDVAWCEWIVRTHHPESANYVPGLFNAYGSKPNWASRHAAMIAKCTQLLDFAREFDSNSPTVATRAHQLAVTTAWVESG